MAKPKKKDDAEPGIKVICRNRRAFHQYNVSDRMECGIVLTGTEVKSLRDGTANLEDAYAKVEDGEVWLIGSDIPEYAMGNRMNHKPKRRANCCSIDRKSKSSPAKPRSAASHLFRRGCTSRTAGPKSKSPSPAANNSTTSAKTRRKQRRNAKYAGLSRGDEGSE